MVGLATAHAVEAYIGRSTTRDTREASLTAVRLIFENLDTAYADGNNPPMPKRRFMSFTA